MRGEFWPHSPPSRWSLTRVTFASGVGKSCLLLRFCDDAYTPSFITTIGIGERRHLDTVLP